MSLAVEVAGKTDIGCVRANNEDNLGYDSRYGVYVVCDGMGGAAAGEVASKMGVDTVLLYFRQAARNGKFPTVGTVAPDASPRANTLGSAIHLANEAIFAASQEHAAQAGMGSTIVAVRTEGNFYSIGHVGDSRIYLIRQGTIQQLTNDHSLVMEQVRRGLITMEQARTVDYQNIVIRALGAEGSVQPDLDDMMAMDGDTLLLCSDGLTRHVDDDAILEIVSGTLNLQLACDRLVQTARDGGGADNITAMLLRFTEKPWWKVWLNKFIPGGTPKWQNSI